MSAPAAIKFAKGLPTRLQYGERARLFVAQGPDVGVGYCLLGDRLLLGRDDADVALQDPNVSRHHLELRWNGKGYAARDLGSANGFLVNKRRVMDAVLNYGDVLLVGASVIEVVSPGVAKGRLMSSEQKKRQEYEAAKKANVAKKRTSVVFALILLILLAYSASEDKVQTFRERGKIEVDEQQAKPGKKLTKEERKRKVMEARDAIKEVITGGKSVTGQREDALRFFKDGVREYNNKNYRRAIVSFQTALTVDPSHNLSKLYLKSSVTAFEKEIKSTFKAAVKAQKALRYSEAKMHYQNVMRFLDDDKKNEMFKRSEEALKTIEKLESDLE